MPKTHQNLSETHLSGADTKEWIVRATDCPALQSHHIAHVGIADAAVPYSMVRTHLSGSYLLACTSGSGKILLDGRWQLCRAGMACLAPPHVLHAFHAIPRERWGFAWVRYESPAGRKPVITSISPVMARFEGQPLHAAILGLYHECHGVPDVRAVHHWVELIHSYVRRFAQPWHLDHRLWQLWETVNAKLGEEWTLETLAQRSHFSAEHLRRLCRRELGRSPMHHVTYLRMQHAAALLESTEDKIEAIATAVGYKNPFVFSNTFKKWIGWRPSDYRRRNGP